MWPATSKQKTHPKQGEFFVRRVVEAAGVEPHQRKVTPRAWNPLIYKLLLAFGLNLDI
jgi:hypothetical protein